MFHLTLMGGSEVRLKELDNIVVTVMGGTEILVPTIAEKILYLRRLKQEYGSELKSASRRTNVITLMGATVTKIPTLGREIEELVQLRESGVMSNEELMKLWFEVLEKDDLDIIEYVTIMGGSGEEVPEEDEEIAALERLVLCGLLSPEEFDEVKQILTSENYSGPKSRPIMEKLRSLLFPQQLYSVSSKRNAQPSHLLE
jgi:hypothetical protein